MASKKGSGPIRPNGAIRPLLVDLNGRAFKKLPGARQSVFEELDRPALQPLPLTPYEFAAWKVRYARIWCISGG